MNSDHIQPVKQVLAKSPILNGALQRLIGCSQHANVNRNVAPSLGGEDFSYMLQKVPGAMAWIGNGPGEGGCFLHNARYDFNDDALPIGVSFFVRLAERFLERQDA